MAPETEGIRLTQTHMKEGLTHIIFVVDRSGSMKQIASDMIGAYNEFIEEQRKTPKECFVSFYQFDDVYEPVFERIPLTEIKPLDKQTYVPRNMTALYDAIGTTVDDYGKYLADLPEEERPERILFVTITDGLNNASDKYTLKDVQERVKHQTEKYGWDFVFLGSNIDAWDTGASFGVAAAATLQFANSAGSVKQAFASLSKNVTSYRSAAVKAAYLFDESDLKAQDEFLADDQKAKNKEQQKKVTT